MVLVILARGLAPWTHFRTRVLTFPMRSSCCIQLPIPGFKSQDLCAKWYTSREIFGHGKIITMIRKFFLESLVHSNKFQSSFLQCTSNLSLARLEGFKRLWNLEMNWKDWRDRWFGRDWTVCIGLESWECSFESLEGLHKFWELRESSFESLTCLHRFGELRECSFESLESAAVLHLV